MSELLVLARSDIDRIEVDTGLVRAAVANSYRGLAQGNAQNPRKVKLEAGPSTSYSMVGRCRGNVGFKTSYTHDPEPGRGTKNYFTTLTLYDDTTGRPLALLDGARIGAMRTAAVTALLAEVTAPPDPTTMLLIGTGRQGQESIGPLLASLPTLTTVLLAGSHRDGLKAVRRLVESHDVRVEMVDTVDDVAPTADVIVAAAGPGTSHRVSGDRVALRATTILVGYGLDASCLWNADRVIATDADQMAVTGTDMLNGHTSLPPVDAQLPAILSGAVAARTAETQRIFAYNSGLVITDIAVAQAVYARAVDLGVGTAVDLWS